MALLSSLLVPVIDLGPVIDPPVPFDDTQISILTRAQMLQSTALIAVIQGMFALANLEPNGMPRDRAQDAINQVDDVPSVFDFIVVGAGSAGAIVAARLTENPDVNVLLIEAGGDPPEIANYQALWLLMQDTDVDWKYRAVPNKGCKAKVGGICEVPRGKVLGGSSTINGMLYLRGKKLDYDRWAQLGNVGWNWDTLLPYFKKWENNHANTDPAYHGTNGPVDVAKLAPINKGHEYFIRNAEANNIPFVTDMNADIIQGIWNTDAYRYDDMRSSTAEAFLKPAANRTNLFVFKQTEATQILFDGENRATGVNITIKTKSAPYQMTVWARKEVIVSAGAINSPKLLMLSGIGRRDELSALNIPVVVDSPQVGLNLYDHPFAMNCFTFDAIPSVVADIQMFRNTGVLASPLQIISFSNTKNDTTKSNVETLLYIIPPSTLDLGLLLQQLHIQPQIQATLLEANRYKCYGCFFNILLDPESSGSVKLDTANPADDPTIDLNYFDVTADLDTMVEITSQQYEYENSEELKSIGFEFIQMNITECNEHKFKSAEYARCINLWMTNSLYHPIGTCTMSPTNTEGVVDNELRVYGAKNLRVIDASIMPRSIQGHTNAPTMMIGEKGADLIKTAWRIN